MSDNFEVLASRKTGLDSKESYIVVRNGVSFLRVLGSEPEWQLMTATASEDDGAINVCGCQRRLMEAALRLGAQLGTDPKVKSDWLGREYVKICNLAQPAGREAEFDEAVLKCFRDFFALYDRYAGPAARPKSELDDLYDLLATDDDGGDVYLSDGVWLSSDGSVHDRGR